MGYTYKLAVNTFILSSQLPDEIINMINSNDITGFNKMFGYTPSEFIEWKYSKHGDEDDKTLKDYDLYGNNFMYYPEDTDPNNLITWMKFLIKKVFEPRKIYVNGTLEWRGEEYDDTGKYIVDNNIELEGCVCEHQTYHEKNSAYNIDEIIKTVNEDKERSKNSQTAQIMQALQNRHYVAQPPINLSNLILPA